MGGGEPSPTVTPGCELRGGVSTPGAKGTLALPHCTLSVVSHQPDELKAVPWGHEKHLRVDQCFKLSLRACSATMTCWCYSHRVGSAALVEGLAGVGGVGKEAHILAEVYGLLGARCRRWDHDPCLGVGRGRR